MVNESASCSLAQVRATILGCLCIFAMGGVIFGVSSIYPQLYDMNSYRGLCDAQRVCTLGNGQPCCDSELQAISLYSSIGFFVADGAAAPWGEIVDRFGSRICLMCAAFLSIASMLLIGTGLWTEYAHVAETYGSEGSTKGDVLFSVGLVIIGGAGPGIFNGIYTGCLSLPGETRSAFYEAALATLVAGSFDLSSLVFNLFDAVGTAELGITLHASFYLWAIFSCGLVVITLLIGIPKGGKMCDPRAVCPSPYDASLQPLDAAKADATEASKLLPGGKEEGAAGGGSPVPATELKQQGSYGSNLLGQLTGGVLGTSAKDMEAAASKERQEALLQREALEMEAARRKPPSGPWESFLRPIYRVVCTPHNLLVVGVMVVLNLSMSHYITSHQAYLQIMLDRGGNSTVAEAISDAFDTLFPILGFCASIGVSPLLTTHAWIPFAVLAVVSNLWLLMTIIQAAWAQWVSIIIFGPMRTLQWAAFYRIVGATPELYDPGSVGRALGYNGLIIAILGDAMNPILMSLAQNNATSDQQLANFTYIKAVLLCLLLPVSLALPYYLKTCAKLNPHRMVEWSPSMKSNNPAGAPAMTLPG